MARPRKDTPPDQFTSTEVAVGAGLTPRNIGVLMERVPDLLPPAIGSTGRSGHRLFDMEGFGRGAIIGGFFRAGIEIITAARLVARLADDPNIGSKVSNLSTLIQRPFNPSFPHFPWEEKDDDESIEDDYWLHNFLMSRTNYYRPGYALPNDHLIEIVDREIVFHNVLQEENGALRPAEGPPNLAPYPLFTLSGWEKGSDPVVDPIPSQANYRTMEAYRKANASRFDRRRNYTGIVSINISLAIRNALDAVADYRAAALADTS